MCTLKCETIYDKIKIGRREFIFKTTKHESGTLTSIVGELKTNTKFHYCKLMTNEELPKINIDDFCRVFSLNSIEKQLEELKKITKPIFIAFEVPEEEWNQRIEEAREFLEVWTAQFRKNGEKKVPNTIRYHLRNNFQTILLDPNFKLK